MIITKYSNENLIWKCIVGTYIHFSGDEFVREIEKTFVVNLTHRNTETVSPLNSKLLKVVVFVINSTN